MASDKTEKTAPAGFLAVLEAKYAALGKLIESYRAAESLGALGAPGDLNVSVFEQISTSESIGQSMELPRGALLGKSLPAAIKLYLSAMRKKLTTREIATALKDGGVESTSENFENIVTTALNRLKAAGEVLRFRDGWGLAELYPASLRSNLANDSRPAGKAAKARGKKPGTRKRALKAKKVAQSARRTSVGTAEKAGGSIQPGLEQRINAYLQTRGTDFSSVQELASQLKVAAQVLNLTLGKMRKAGKIERNQNGLVRLTRKAA